MTDSRGRVAAFWDAHVAAWLGGDDPMPQALPRWFASYQGRGDGEVTREGFPEPYVGDLLGLITTPRVVVLGLNPGRYHPRFQSRQGLFADEIRAAGKYSAWSASMPYTRPPWTALIGRNRYHDARVTFARRWLKQPTAPENTLLIFELYPWHSTRVTDAMRPPPDLIDEFVWQPVAELPTTDVFAFGRPWQRLATGLGLRQLAALGAGGTDYGSGVPSRAVRVYRLPSGQRLVIEWHSGSAGPPGDREVDLLRGALG